jgi:hypothetical protein
MSRSKLRVLGASAMKNIKFVKCYSWAPTVFLPPPMPTPTNYIFIGVGVGVGG